MDDGLYLDGKTVRLNYAWWVWCRGAFGAERPPQPGHFRVDIEMAMCPLNDPAQITFWYACDEWTTVVPVKEYIHPNGRPAVRSLFEACHHQATGERVILYSTFCSIWPEPWGRGIPQVYAFFRGQFWWVTHLEWVAGHDYPGRFRYPLTSRTYKYFDDERNNLKDGAYADGRSKPPTFPHEPADEAGSFLPKLSEDIFDDTGWLILADWLDERHHPLGWFIRCHLDSDRRMKYWPNELRPNNMRTLTAVAARVLGGLKVESPEDPKHNPHVRAFAGLATRGLGDYNYPNAPDRTLYAG